jgi:hypothetical protein
VAFKAARLSPKLLPQRMIFHRGLELSVKRNRVDEMAYIAKCAG